MPNVESMGCGPLLPAYVRGPIFKISFYCYQASAMAPIAYLVLALPRRGMKP